MAAQPSLVSASEYLANELTSEVRHEYVAGSVYAMAGGSRNHLEITSNLAFLLRRDVSLAPCRNLVLDVKVWVARANAYFYPDALIACPPQFVDEPSGILINPTVIFEVISPGTAIFDRGAKFAAYRSLESLREYVLIESESALVNVNSLEGGEWKLRTYTGSEAVALIPSVEGRLSLAELYQHTSI